MHLNEYTIWLENHMKTGNHYVSYKEFCSINGLDFIEPLPQKTNTFTPSKEHTIKINTERSCCGGGKVI